MMLNEEEYYLSCCCSRVRADTAAHIIGVIYLVSAMFHPEPIGVVTALFLVLAKGRQSPCLYLPFLIVHVRQIE
jgi:hypothetical protein